jgi:hypothetical protein
MSFIGKWMELETMLRKTRQAHMQDLELKKNNNDGND